MTESDTFRVDIPIPGWYSRILKTVISDILEHFVDHSSVFWPVLHIPGFPLRNVSAMLRIPASTNSETGDQQVDHTLGNSRLISSFLTLMWESPTYETSTNSETGRAKRPAQGPWTAH